MTDTRAPGSLFRRGAQAEWTLANGSQAAVHHCEHGPLGEQAADLVVASRGYLAFALGDGDRRARLFAPGLARDRLAALMLDGRFAGYVAFEQDGRGALEPRLADFRRVYGAGGLWRAAVHRLAAERAPAEAIYLDQLFVAPRFRRRGAARLICSWLADAARRAGYRTLLVDVAAGNAAAIALYESLGFRRASAGLGPGRRLVRALAPHAYRRYALDLTRGAGAPAQG
ncbi:MAG: GNAT family N-acetyltransferase [Methylobacteriaceae bacterium]|nr:GNAT family N-acetyltransferase [Methylobacteriaceae bacterium]